MGEASEAGTFFRAFDPDEFIAWPSWVRLKSMLSSNGGCYGLAGPRGAGKSWHMMKARSEIEDPDPTAAEGVKAGLGLWYPSPSEYDSHAFLSSLSDSLAQRIEERLDPPEQAILRTQRLQQLIRRLLVALALAALLALLKPLDRQLGSEVYRMSSYTSRFTAGATLFVILAVPSFLLYQRRKRWEQNQPEARLVRRARLLREQIRYTATQREGNEFGAEGGRWITAKFTRSKERELVERPTTLSSLVNDFRTLAERTAEVVGSVLIAIDELDKMADPEKVKALLRDIKGIFEIPNVYFLVSVSDEAVRALNLGAVTERDEFNSSFYTVIDLRPVSPQECARLLTSRREGFDEQAAIALGVLAGGIPREVVRLADLATVSAPDEPWTVTTAVRRVMREEAVAYRREVITVTPMGRTPLTPEEALGAYKALPDEAFSEENFIPFAETVIGEQWIPEWAGSAWSRRFAEGWRRLLVRIAIAGLLADDSTNLNEHEATRLQRIAILASQSADVAEVALTKSFGVEGARRERAIGTRDSVDAPLGVP